MPNTITLSEPQVNDLLISYTGIQLERASSPASAFTVLVQLPYVIDQTTYTYIDASGGSTDWYRSVRYAPGGLGPYSSAWPVTPPAVSGLTLARLEQEVARRVGPYYRLPTDRQVPSTATFERAFFPGLRSSVEQDLVTNLWILRRGIDWQGQPAPVDPDDRQRTVAVYDPQDGSVQVDRPWSRGLVPGEVCEFHHLDPEQQLRPSVRAGLRRCAFEERFSLGSGYIYETDLTESVPWLTDPNQVSRVQVAPFPTGFVGSPGDMPYTVFGQSGHVCIRLNTGGHGPYYGGVLVTAIRPVESLVNGLDSTSGPLIDTDTLNVDLDYAASAGHIEAWHAFPASLQAAAAGGTQATQAMAALEFTRQTRIHAPRRYDLYQLSELFGGYGLGSPVVVNA